MTEQEITAIADAAVERTLLRLGIDPDDPTEFAERKKDFAYLRTLRIGSEIFRRQGIATVAKVLTTFLIAAAVAAAVKWFGWLHT